MTFYKKDQFSSQTPKNTIFLGFFLKFSFSIFSYFLFFFLQHKKDKNKKCTFFFENPFLTPWQTAKKLFSHPYTLFVFFKIPKKHYKIGENKQKKSWTKFWRNLGPSFDSKNPKSWTKFWLYSTYIYTHRERWLDFCYMRVMVPGCSELKNKITTIRFWTNFAF